VLDAINPKTVIKIAGKIASAILSSPAYWYILTDNVSKLKGLNKNVNGNSFIVSTNTKRVPTKIGPFKIGMWICLIIFDWLAPNIAAASSIFGETRSNPESIVPFEIVKKRVIYPQMSKITGAIKNLELVNVSKEIARTVPGIAYPIPDKNVIIFIKTLLFHLLAKDTNIENDIARNATIAPSPIVLVVRINNSELNPLWIWSIFIETQSIGMPSEKNAGNKAKSIAAKDL